MGQDNNGEMFLNADGSQNAYFIDTLHIDSLVIVRSKKNGHFFAIRNPSKKDLKGNIWNSPETYLYDYDPFDSWYLTNMPYDAVPNAIGVSNRKRGVLYEKYSRLNTKSYQIMGHSIVPKYYEFYNEEVKTEEKIKDFEYVIKLTKMILSDSPIQDLL